MSTKLRYKPTVVILAGGLLATLLSVLWASDAPNRSETPPKNITEQYLRDQYCAQPPASYDRTLAASKYGHSHQVVCR